MIENSATAPIVARRMGLRRGLTLIELLIVIAVLAVLAAVIVPRLMDATRPARFAAAADILGELTKNLTYYQQLNKKYPDYWDSLQSTNNTAYTKLRPHVLAGKQRFVLQAVTDDSTGQWFSSLKKAGITTVVDHDEAETDPNNSGKNLRVLAKGNMLASINPTPAADQPNILARLFPAGMPTTVRTVVLGFGPANTANGNSLISSPVIYDDLTTNYDRCLVVFYIYSDGRHARLATVLEPHGDDLNAMRNKFDLESQPQ